MRPVRTWHSCLRCGLVALCCPFLVFTSSTHAALGLQISLSEAEYVWYRHPVQAWSHGRVIRSSGASITVHDVSLSTEHTVARAETHPYDSSHAFDLDDIAHMNNMHEGTFLAFVVSRAVLMIVGVPGCSAALCVLSVVCGEVPVSHVCFIMFVVFSPLVNGGSADLRRP